MAQEILVIDDDEGVLSALGLLLKTEGYRVTTLESPERVPDVIKKRDFELVLMDLNYTLDTTSGEEGLRLIHTIRRHDEHVPIVVMTGWGTIEVAVDAMKHGSNDFIQKPWDNDQLLAIIRNQIHIAQIQYKSERVSQHNQLLTKQLSSDGNIVAESQAMKSTLAVLDQVAASDVSVLLTGENGTGKTALARRIHELSARKTSSLVTVNMGAVTESLFESEMFGHVKGAFTDAKATKIGRIELADEGTLFLDEIANTPFSQQGKLLRVLEEKQFEKIGAIKTQSVDFRLICATNANLEEAVEAGIFRQDLLYRINTIEVELPPLRERVEDIIPIAKSVLSEIAKKYSKPELRLSDEAINALKSYSWPGNVRELKHVIERANVLCNESTILSSDLGLKSEAGYDRSHPEGKNDEKTMFRLMSEIEADVIEKRMAHFEQNANQAAESLGMSRSAFYRRLEKIKQS